MLIYSIKSSGQAAIFALENGGIHSGSTNYLVVIF